MKNRKILLCEILGHKINPDAFYSYGLHYCERCQEEVDPNEVGIVEWIRLKIYIKTGTLRMNYRLFKEWLKCPDCGKHFGRHDAEVDHLPF